MGFVNVRCVYTVLVSRHVLSTRKKKSASRGKCSWRSRKKRKVTCQEQATSASEDREKRNESRLYLYLNPTPPILLFLPSSLLPPQYTSGIHDYVSSHGVIVTYYLYNSRSSAIHVLNTHHQLRVNRTSGLYFLYSL